MPQLIPEDFDISFRIVETKEIEDETKFFGFIALIINYKKGNKRIISLSTDVKEYSRSTVVKDLFDLMHDYFHLNPDVTFESIITGEKIVKRLGDCL